MQETLPQKHNYCRKCQKILPYSNFYKSVDCGFVDTNGYMSVCKNCIQIMYNELFENLKTMEKTIHKLCTSLNIKYSNDAVSATRKHIETLLSNGKNVKAIFGIYRMKLIATKKTMDKSKIVDQTYEDVGTIYTREPVDTTKAPIPKEVIDFWGEDLPPSDIRFLEKEYKNFKKAHATETYAQTILIKEICYTLLDIKKVREEEDISITDIKKLEDTLQSIMGNLAITPKEDAKKDIKDSGEETFGLWIRDIEKSEPAQWLKTDPRGDMYRDVGNVERYFENYFVRPMKNFITMSKDFHIEEDITDEDAFIAEYDEKVEFTDLDNGGDTTNDNSNTD